MSYDIPKLKNWEETRDTIQKISHLLKEVQRNTIEPRQMSLEHSINIYPKGVFGQINDKGFLYYHFAQEKLIFKSDTEEFFQVSVKKKSLDVILSNLKSEFSKHGVTIDPDTKEISGSEKLSLNNNLAKETALTIWKLYSALARVKSEIFGTTSPLVMWSHHFDFAFLYFSTEKITESDPTIAFGFAPYSEGISRPYAYIYAWNGSEYVDLDKNNLPEKVNWWEKGWKGVYLSYDDMLTFKDPIKKFEDFFRLFFDRFKSKL